MTDIKKPEALRLAEWLDNRTMKMLQDREAARELRRLHAELEATDRQVEILTDELSKCDKENAKLREALSKYADENYNGYNANGAHARAALEQGEKT